MQPKTPKWRSWRFGWRFAPGKAPLLELRSDGTTETTALELPVPIPRTVRIAKYFTIFSVATIFGLVASPPCAAADSGRFASIFDLTGRLAPQYARFSHLDQAPCESCGISRFFSASAHLPLPLPLPTPTTTTAHANHARSPPTAISPSLPLPTPPQPHSPSSRVSLITHAGPTPIRTPASPTSGFSSRHSTYIAICHALASTADADGPPDTAPGPARSL